VRRAALVVALLLAAPAAASPGGWLAETTLYGVVPRNFGPDGAAAVERRLDTLARLGVGALWLAPLNRTLPGDYGYAVTDYQALRPDFGDAAALRRLVAAAHRRGMKVLVDVVPNHTSADHPWVRRHPERYDRAPDGTPTHYFDWAHLPNLDYRHPAVRAEVTRMFEWYVEAFDVDGFRIDAAWGVRDRAPDFFPRLLRHLRRKKPTLAFLAEARAAEPYWREAGFDAAYDWGAPLGKWAWHDAFAQPGEIAGRLHAALTAAPPTLPPLRFLNNNDTGTRFIGRHGLALSRVATTLLFTLPGVPLLFTGDEVGAAFHPYEDGARPIDWRDAHDLFIHHRALVALRRREPLLRTGDLLPLAPRPGERSYASLRRKGGAARLVVLNFGKGTVAPLRPPPGQSARAGLARDLLTGAWVPLAAAADGSFAAPVAPFSALVLELEGQPPPRARRQKRPVRLSPKPSMLR
jgi:glycosidase